MYKKWFYMEFPQGMRVQFMHGIEPRFITEVTLVESILIEHDLTNSLLKNKLDLSELRDGKLVKRKDLLDAAFETNSLFKDNKIEIIFSLMSFESRELILAENRKAKDIIEMLLKKEGIDLSGYFKSVVNSEFQFKLASIAISIWINHARGYTVEDSTDNPLSRLMAIHNTKN